MAEPAMPGSPTPGSPEVAAALLSLGSGGDFAQGSLRLYGALFGAKLLEPLP